jgi:phage repressor protein C with HTH and peptisase S24 domain
MAEIVGERLLRLIDDRRLSQSALARLIGISQPSVGRLISGDTRETGKILELARALRTSPEYLVGEVDDPDLVGSLVPFQASSTSVEQFGMRMIPEINLDFALGGGAFIDGPIETTMVPFRKDWLDRISRYGPADVFLTRGDGDSMMPTILDEDDILVNRADRVITRQDRIWAIAYGDLATIKRVRRTATGSFLLMSDNTAVSPIEAAEDEIHVVGRVIWIGRKM